MYENMLQNALNCTFKKNFGDASRHATIFWGLDYNSPAPKKSCPPPLGKSCIRPWTTIKKLFEEMSSQNPLWQTVR